MLDRDPDVWHRLPVVSDLEAFARRIRRHAVEMTARSGGSHIGSNLSIADIIATLYGRVLRVDALRPEDPSRDRMILSKGHACAILYAALAERGFFPTDWLKTFYADGSPLGGHVMHKGVPGVEVSTGSLGHGLPLGVGMAAGIRASQPDAQVFVLLSDGECDEGSVWEAALFASHHRLHNLVAIIDYNKIQSLGTTSETIELEPFADKWRSFGWRCIEVDGHDLESLSLHLDCERGTANGRAGVSDTQPRCVIAHTVKGKGVSFMESSVLWHYRSASTDELSAALAELESSQA